eukprot:scaffold4101_cov267-Pinguiococcus_pyrenoidosus.AAC.6
MTAAFSPDMKKLSSGKPRQLASPSSMQCSGATSLSFGKHPCASIAQNSSACSPRPPSPSKDSLLMLRQWPITSRTSMHDGSVLGSAPASTSKSSLSQPRICSRGLPPSSCKTSGH